MRDLILITPHNYGLNEFESNLKDNLNLPAIRDGKSISLEFKKSSELFGDFVQIEQAPEVKNFYETNELRNFKKYVDEPEFYLVHFKDINHLKMVLKHIVDRSDVFVDNDSGLVLSGKDFIKLCEEKPDWDWAKE